MKVRSFGAVAVAGMLSLNALQASAAVVAVGKDFSLDDANISRIELLGVDNVGDPSALVTYYSAAGSCLTYSFENTANLNQDLRLVFYDANSNVLDLPIITVNNAFYSSVDPSCDEVNVPPVAVDDPYGGDFLGQNVLSNDTDANGDPLTAILETSAQYGEVVLDSDGTFTYTPAPGTSGPDSFTYRASDPGQALSEPATVSLIVDASLPNRPPVAVDDPFGSNYQGRSVLANDSDLDGDELNAILLEQPGNGSVQLNSNGTFTYTPNAGFSGNDSFRYRANDGQLNSEQATVTLTVAETALPNRPPQAANDPFGSNYAGKNVLANDVDPDGDTITAALVSTPQNGDLNLRSDGSFTYTPEPGFSGEVSFTYRANDGELNSNIATVSLLVEIPDDNLPPVAVDDPFGSNYAGKNVLDNDSDPNNDVLIALLVTEPEGGELILDQDGTFTFRAFSGFTGETSFTYQARDRAIDDAEGMLSNVATVTLAVDGDEQGEGGLTGKEDSNGDSVLGDASVNELGTSTRIDLICERINPETAGEEDLFNLCSGLRKQGTTADQALAALTAITPEEVAAISKAIRVLSFSRFRNLGGRMARVRGGSKGLSIAGLNLNYGDQQVSGRELDAMAQEAMKALGGGASGDELREDSKLGLFVRGDLNFGEQDDTELESGFDFDAQSLTLGADYRFTDTFFAGASFSFGTSEVDFAADGGSTDTDNYAVSAYGSWYSPSGLYLDGIVNYGWSDIETRRNIAYQDFGGSVDRVAKGSTDGTEYFISVNAGYNFNYGRFNFDPLVRFFYLDGDVDGFTENGALGWDLDIDDQSFKSTSLGASAQVSYTFLPAWGVVTPYLRIEYTSEFEDNADGVRYRFANDPFKDGSRGTQMMIQADDPESSYLVYGAGFAVQFRYGLGGFLSYQRLGSYENLDGEILSFGMRWEARF